MLSRILAAGVLAWAGSALLTTALSAQPSAPQAKDGVFSAAQATRGQSSYGVFCAGCHADDLAGTNSGDSGAPPLKHDKFMRGSTIGALFTKIQTRMPLDAPGTLADQQVLDLIAYLLRENGFPPGSSDLPASRDELGRIAIR